MEPHRKYIDAQSLASDITGNAIRMGDCSEVTFIAVTTATGTPSGQWFLQGSHDGATWATIAEAAGAFPESGALAAGNYAWAFTDVNYEYVRLFWDVSSGGTGATASVSYRLR